MPSEFSPILGAQGFQQSNPGALSVVTLLGVLQTIKEVGMMPALRERSLGLTGALEKLLLQSKFYVPLHEAASARSAGFTIITPTDPESRGAQLSLLFLPTGSEVMRTMSTILQSYGVIGDKREPDVIRLAPAPLYSSLKDCERAASCLEKAFEQMTT